MLGAVVQLDGDDVRIPACGINAYLEAHPWKPQDVNPITARTVGELRRKAASEKQNDGAA